jgi:hypothetical protein
MGDDIYGIGFKMGEAPVSILAAFVNSAIRAIV